MTVLDRFTIHQPQSVVEASQMLARFGPDAAIYAGGTELLIVIGGMAFIFWRVIVGVRRNRAALDRSGLDRSGLERPETIDP